MKGDRAREILGAWAPVALWAAGILLLTSVPVPVEAGRGLHHLDKAVHAAMYAGLGWTLARALHLTGRSTIAALSLATVAAAGFAGLDEWHQSWVGREPSLADWTADAAGLLVGLGLFLWLRRGSGRGVREDDRSPTGDDGKG